MTVPSIILLLWHFDYLTGRTALINPLRRALKFLDSTMMLRMILVFLNSPLK